jgi:Flp pilus assembly protein TadG
LGNPNVLVELAGIYPPEPASKAWAAYAARTEGTLVLRARVEVEVRLHRTDRGASAVEFAVVFPLLIMLVFGIIEFGLLVNTNVVVANATRDAARTASLGGTEADIRAQATAGLASLSARDKTAVTVTVTCQKAAAACPVYTATTSGDTAIVSIQVVHSWLFRLWPLPSVTIVKTNQMRIE